MTAYTDKALPEILHDMELLHKLLYIRKPFGARGDPTDHPFPSREVEHRTGAGRKTAAAYQQPSKTGSGAQRYGDAIAMHDSTGHLVFANQVYEELLGLKENELKKIPPRDLSARFEERFRNRICATWREGSSSTAATWWKRPALAKSRSSGCSTVPPHRCAMVAERKLAASSYTGTCPRKSRLSR